MYYCYYFYYYSNTLTSLIPHVWQKTTSCVRLSLLPVVLSDSTLWLSASRDMHILIHHLLPTGLPAVHTCASVTSADVQADQLQQEHKRTVLRDVQYKFKGLVVCPPEHVTNICSHMTFLCLACLSFVDQAEWEVAACFAMIWARKQTSRCERADFCM